MAELKTKLNDGDVYAVLDSVEYMNEKYGA